MNKKTRCFLAGAILQSALQSLHQDLLGKARYLAAVDAEWLPARITVPFALVSAVLAFLMYLSKDDEGKP